MMGFFRKIIKNVLPYGFVKQWQIRSGTNAFEPGGYYSPIPSMGDIKSHNFEAGLPSELPGIDLNTGEQQNLLNSFEQYCNEAPFTNKKLAGGGGGALLFPKTRFR
jgi:hypothetical protein